MKTYKLLKDLPWCTIWMLFKRNNKDQRYYEGNEYNSMMFNDALSEWYLEEVKKDYIVTEEGEIIGKYEWDCWYLNEERNTCYTSYVSGSEVDHFITKEQCERREIKESALRKLWELYYENWYEENKGDYEIYYSLKYSVFVTGKDVCNTSLPHCNQAFQENMINIPEIKALYLTYFWLDGK